METCDVNGNEAEVIVRSDGRALWVHVDGDVTLRARVDSVTVHDQRETTLEELVDCLSTEIRELRLKCSQYAEASRRKEADCRYDRKYNEANKHAGRREVYDMNGARLQKIIDEYKLTG